MPRMMADPAYFNNQMANIHHQHITAINLLVERLREDNHPGVPYVDPMYGGINATLLSILSDPGPMAVDGFLSWENDDQTAERVYHFFHDVNIPAESVVPWNIYPWPNNNGRLTATQIQDGVGPLIEIMGLISGLTVVMLHGGNAKKGWQYLMAEHNAVIEGRNIHVIETFHPGRKALWHRDVAIRNYRENDLRAAFANAAALIVI